MSRMTPPHPKWYEKDPVVFLALLLGLLFVLLDLLALGGVL